MKVSFIDIGTQSIKHYIFNVEKGSKNIVYYKRYSDAHLGSGELKVIEIEAMNRNISILKECAIINTEHRIDKTILVGTQALRVAPNADMFIQATKDTFGVDIIIIDQTDEARYLYKGLAPLLEDLVFGAVNIGGGSTEIVVGDSRELLNTNILEIGVKTLRAKFSDGEISDWGAMDEYLDEVIIQQGHPISSLFITGALDFYLATATHLGLVSAPCTIPHHPMSFSIQSMREFVETLRTTPTEELKRLYPQDPGFADNVAIGQTLYYKVAEKYKVEVVIPSRNDLIDGLIVELL